MRWQMGSRWLGHGAFVVLLAIPAPRSAHAQPSAAAFPQDVQQPQTAPQPGGESIPQMVPEGATLAQPAAEEIESAPSDGGRPDFWPPMEGPGLTWFAVVVILALTLQLKPLLSERNLDGLVLAAMCLLLALRTDWSRMPAWAAGQTAAWWSYVLLSVAAGYFLLRGLLMLGNGPLRRHEPNVTAGALLVLLVAGLVIDIRQIATAPLSTESRDCLVGGLYTAQTHRLPYGQVEPHDRRGPLLYLLHAAAVQLVPPTVTPDPASPQIEMSWSNRPIWEDRAWWLHGDFAPVRLVNGLLFLLALTAVYALCAKLHSPAIGLTAVAIWCVFTGTVECLTQPGIMLASALTGWSLFFATVRIIGPFISILLALAAGLTWPWAFLTLPVLLGYFFRTAWPAATSLVGLAAGVAAAVALLASYTVPTPPRADAALRMAGKEPPYAADLGDDAVLRISHRAPGKPPHHGLLKPLWQFLVDSENLVLDLNDFTPGRSRVYLADGVNPQALLYRNLDPSERARQEIADRYRLALQREPLTARIWTALRCVLEQTWLAAEPPEPLVTSAWTVWAGPEPGKVWGAIRRVAKLGAGVLAIAAGLALMRRLKVQLVHLSAGLLSVAGATLLASNAGAVTNLVWLLAPALAVWSACEPAATPAPAAQWSATPEPPPRISVE